MTGSKKAETFEDSVGRVRALLVARGVKGAVNADIAGLANMAAAAAFQDARPANAAQRAQQKAPEGNHGWKKAIAQIERRPSR